MTRHGTATAVALTAALLTSCTSAAAPTAAGCEPVQRPQLQEGSHLIGDAAPPVPYSSSPPTSGWHASGRPIDFAAYVEPVSEPDQVQALEQGGVVVAYDPALPDDQVGGLNLIPGEVDRVVVTPYPDAPAPVTMTAWGVLQACDAVTAADVAAFRDAHALEPGH